VRGSVRALIDTNILVSYFLPSADPARTINRIIKAAVDGAFTLVLPDDLVDELVKTLSTKPYLRRRVTPEQAASVLRDLQSIADRIPRLAQPVPAIVRDAKEDYLLAAAITRDVDLLVTGDNDLLALREAIDRPRIMTAAEFLDLLEAPNLH
jgi:putative PIN family toxin of toxin-antitoxin system